MRLINDDCIAAMCALADDGVKVHSVVTDPPYCLDSIRNRFGKENSAPAQHGNDGAFSRASKGFLGKEWDNDIAFQTDVWQACYELLHDGGHVLAFSATRNYHHMAVAIERAGFEIRNMIGWIYGTGFPKGKDLGDGWNTALKPALEPICLARKPFSTSAKANHAENGCGGYNIDDCRLTTSDENRTARSVTYNKDVASRLTKHGTANFKSGVEVMQDKDGWQNGRYPANIIHDGSLDSEYSNYFYCAKPSAQEKHISMSYESTRNYTDWTQYIEKVNDSNAKGNTHPTVKPIALMEYLIKLITPEHGIVIDPFMGSGTTGIAAVKNFYDFIGIEKESEYFAIAEKRINHASSQLKQQALL